MRTTFGAIKDPPHRNGRPTSTLLPDLFRTATIQGNSPYSASLSLFPINLKSMPFWFLKPQVPTGRVGVLGVVVDVVILDLGWRVVLGEGVVVVGFAVGSKFKGSPFGGILQQISRKWSHLLSPDLQFEDKKIIFVIRKLFSTSLLIKINFLLNRYFLSPFIISSFQ